jgi:thioredoxin reductase
MYEGVFVIGDVKNQGYKQLTIATSDGTIAALNIIEYLHQNKYE